MAEEDLAFTFDASGFNAAIKSMTEKLTKLGDTSGKVSGDSAESTAKGVTKGLIHFELLKKGVEAILGSVKEFIPEIGQTLSISKEIILKNFMMPLRKELLPILQGILNWTRDNRANFVRFGEVMVSVFRLVKTVFTSAFEVMKPLFNTVMGFIKSMSGGGSIFDTINVIMFKLTASVLFIMELLKPLEAMIAGIIASFGKGFGDVFKGFKFDVIEKLAHLFVQLDEAVTGLKPAFEALAGVIGTVFGTAIKGALTYIGAAIDSLTYLIDLTKAIVDKKDIGAVTKAYQEKLKGDWENMFGKDKSKGIGGGVKVDDAIITKDGKVIHTSPQDNIVATKSLPFPGGSTGREGKGGPVDVNFNFGNFSFQVTEGNAQNAGKNFASGLQGQIRNIILDNLVMTGGR